VKKKGQYYEILQSQTFWDLTVSIKIMKKYHLVNPEFRLFRICMNYIFIVLIQKHLQNSLKKT